MPIRRKIARLMLMSGLVALLALAFGAATVEAQQQPPTLQGCPYDIRSGVPFVWLRFESSSTGRIAQTVYPGQELFNLRSDMWFWDGVQWWVGAWVGSNSRSVGWVEFGSLTPRCEPATAVPPTAVPNGGQHASWFSGMFVMVKRNLPFVWVRANPAPNSPSLRTLYPGAALLINLPDPAQDSFGQWWWPVRDPGTGVIGWLEEWSLQPGDTQVPTVTPIPNSGPWVVGDVVRVRGSVPYSWLRTIPSSVAPWVYTAVSFQALNIIGAPQSDGVQRWWNVAVQGLGTQISGWVEEGSLELVSH